MVAHEAGTDWPFIAFRERGHSLMPALPIHTLRDGGSSPSSSTAHLLMATTDFEIIFDLFWLLDPLSEGWCNRQHTDLLETDWPFIAFREIGHSLMPSLLTTQQFETEVRVLLLLAVWYWIIFLEGWCNGSTRSRRPADRSLSVGREVIHLRPHCSLRLRDGGSNPSPLRCLRALDSAGYRGSSFLEEWCNGSTRRETG